MKALSFMFLAIAICFLNFGCSKQETDLKKTCFKGKYIGEGCWPVIQIIEPLDSKFKDSKWLYKDSIYEHAVGTGPLPDKYKDGKAFYFTINSIDSNQITTANCSIPKYSIGLNSYSDSACQTLDQNNN